MIEERRTHREAFLGALKEACLMVIPAVLVAIALAYFLIFRTETFSAKEQVQAWESMRLTALMFPLVMIPLMTLAGWMQKRGEPTRMQIEMREREQAKRLLTKYPDLRG